MSVSLRAAQRRQLRQLQKQRRDDRDVKVTVVLLRDSGWSPAGVAEALGLDEATGYRYGRAFTDLGLEKYLAHLCRQVNLPRYTDVRAMQAGLGQLYQVPYSSCVNAQRTRRLSEQLPAAPPTCPPATSSATTPATTSIRNWRLGWPIRVWCRCSCRRTRPT